MFDFSVILTSFSYQKCHATKRHNKKNKKAEQSTKIHTRQQTQKSCKCEEVSQHYRKGLQMQTWFATLLRRVANANRVRNNATRKTKNIKQSRNSECKNVADENMVRNITGKGCKCKQGSQHNRKGVANANRFATSPQQCIKRDATQNTQQEKQQTKNKHETANAKT